MFKFLCIVDIDINLLVSEPEKSNGWNAKSFVRSVAIYEADALLQYNVWDTFVIDGITNIALHEAGRGASTEAAG